MDHYAADRNHGNDQRKQVDVGVKIGLLRRNQRFDIGEHPNIDRRHCEKTTDDCKPPQRLHGNVQFLGLRFIERIAVLIPTRHSLNCHCVCYDVLNDIARGSQDRGEHIPGARRRQGRHCQRER